MRVKAHRYHTVCLDFVKALPPDTVSILYRDITLKRESLTQEIARLIHARTSEPILSYQRDANDSNSILVLMRGHDPEAYHAQGVRGRWVVYETALMV
jgi:hypothetical protein